MTILLSEAEVRSLLRLDFAAVLPDPTFVSHWLWSLDDIAALAKRDFHQHVMTTQLQKARQNLSR